MTGVQTCALPISLLDFGNAEQTSLIPAITFSSDSDAMELLHCFIAFSALKTLTSARNIQTRSNKAQNFRAVENHHPPTSCHLRCGRGQRIEVDHRSPGQLQEGRPRNSRKFSQWRRELLFFVLISPRVGKDFSLI